MAAVNFQQQTEWLLVHEGGLVNHPRDPGGRTNRGVTQRVYDAYRQRKGMVARLVDHISHSEVLEIYKTQYWDAVRGDQLPSGLDYAVYDFAVNSGPSRSVRFLQELLGVKADGVIGNITLAAIPHDRDELISLIIRFCEKRWTWIQTLSTFADFGNGWRRRIMGETIGAQPHMDNGVIDRAVQVAQGRMDVEGPLAPAVGKADEEDQKTSAVIAAAAKDDKSIAGIGIGIIPGTLAAFAALPEGPIQWALAGILVIGFLMVAYVFMKRFVK